MTGRDEYYNRAKQMGYRSRSAFKLRQLDDDAALLGRGDTVVDLGAAPGGWLQVAAERVGPEGRVIGVDRQRIDPLEDVEPTVETIRGDITDGETIERIESAVGPEGADLVLSDMAPNMSGDYSLDQARSVHLARQAAAVADAVLGAGGDFVVKVFQGSDLDAFRADLEPEYQYVRTTAPDASRDASSEVYVIGKGRLTAPVRPGERLTVEITDRGAEGDGIARIEGYTVFVADASPGETVDVVIDDIKPRFGFASPVTDSDS